MLAAFENDILTKKKDKKEKRTATTLPRYSILVVLDYPANTGSAVFIGIFL